MEYPNGEPEPTDHGLARMTRILGVKAHAALARDWPLPSSRFTATVRGPSVFGTGAASRRRDALEVATMEYTERCAQFTPESVPCAAVKSAADLGTNAIWPTAFGLYSSPQYRPGRAGVSPFDPDAVIEWVEVRELTTARRRMVPVEFVYPRACHGRIPLVAETSSGTAAHRDRAAATLNALCEVVERDSLMLFWYRQPSTPRLPLDQVPNHDVREELHRLEEMGFVVLVLDLAYDLAIPCFLVIALRGPEFAWGAGCHPIGSAALRHAVAELGVRVRWLVQTPARTTLRRPLDRLGTGGDHYGLFNRGTLHDVLRDVLAHATAAEPWTGRELAGSVEDPAELLGCTLSALDERGYRAYVCDLTPPAVAAEGVHVVRVLVPGLVPLHIGHDRLRLGCQRLTDDAAPGTLCTFLPHFFG